MALIGPIGTPEIIIILVVLLLIFGARRLPEMGRSLGKGMREFKDAVTGDDDDKEPAPPPAALPTASSDADAASETDAQSEKPERETVS